MKLKIIQDQEIMNVINWVKEMGEFEDWDLLFDDIPESGLLNSLTFEEMLKTVKPTICKFAETPMRCRYVEKRMKMMWDMFIDEAPAEYKFDLRWAYAHQILGMLDYIEDYPKVNPGVELHFICVLYGLLGDNFERVEKYREKYQCS